MEKKKTFIRKWLLAILSVAMVLCATLGIMLSVNSNTNTAVAEETPNYLTFTAKDGDVEITFNYYDDDSCEYSFDKTEWISIESGASETFQLSKDQNVYFRGENSSLYMGSNFTMTAKTTGATVEASGDITSLINKKGGDVPLYNSSDDAFYYFSDMFEDCTILTKAPNLPSTTLYAGCYSGMFMGCTSLVNAPELPAITLVDDCYSEMFSGCTSLVNAPKLSATTLAQNCCSQMFFGCTSLVNAPELPATNLAICCYSQMFDGCTSLVNAPKLSATNLAQSCYACMFRDCTSLVNAPELPATTLAKNCYDQMFSGCIALETPADISKVTTLAEYCCFYMYNGCTSLKLYSSDTTEGYKTAWTIPNIASASNWNDNMFNSCGTDNCCSSSDPALNTTYYIKDPVNLDNLLTLTAKDGDVSITFEYSTGDSCEYSFDKTEWVSIPATGKTFTLNKDQSVYFRGENVITALTKHFTMTAKTTGATVEASGDVTSLTNKVGGDVTLSEACYHSMFKNCSILTKAPNLPSTTLSNYCYKYMFAFCPSLTTSAELSTDITTITADSCCFSMYEGCSLLTTTMEFPNLTSVTGTSVFQSSYYKCSKLTKGMDFPKLTTVSGNCCFEYLYRQCSALETAGNMSVLTSITGEHCFAYMYEKCTALTTPANMSNVETVSGFGVLASMYSGCSSLLTASDMPKLTTISGKNESDSGVQLNCMYQDCTSLETGANISNITSIEGESTFASMYSGCSKLTSTPALPLVVGYNSYSGMFKDCIALEIAPALPLGVAEGCYSTMFFGCTSLKTAPKLSATVLADYCYSGMFYGCTALETPVDMSHVTQLGENCCFYMYYGCTSLKLYSSDTTDGYKTAWTIPNIESASNWNVDMFTGCGATNCCDTQNGGTAIDVNTTYYIKSQSFAITNGTLEASKSTNNGYIAISENATTGNEVTITVTPNEGYTLDSITVYKTGDKTTTVPVANKKFTMPSYAVTVEATFKLNKLAVSIVETPQTFTYGDSDIKFTVNSEVEGGFTVAYYIDGNWVTTAPKNAGEYNVKVTRAMDETYSALDKVITNGLVINKATLDMKDAKWDYTSAFTYDGTEKKVEVVGLPNGVSVIEYTNNAKTGAGSYTASVEFDYDITNYNEISIADCSWVIDKATYNMSDAMWNYTGAFKYDGNEKKVEVTGLPEGVTVASYFGNVATFAGEYTASVTLNYDTLNYNPVSMNDLDWAINSLSTIVIVTTPQTHKYGDEDIKFTVNGDVEDDFVVEYYVVGEWVTLAPVYAGEYNVKVTREMDENYNAFEQIIVRGLVIEKATYNMSNAKWNWDSGAIYTYTGKEQSVEITGLPEGVTVANYTDNEGINAGTYTASVTLSYDSDNYNEISIEDLTWTIQKANAVITVDDTPIEVTVGETIFFPAATSSFGEVVCDKVSADLVEVGTYTITYTVEGTENYNGATKTIKVTILEAKGLPVWAIAVIVVGSLAVVCFAFFIAWKVSFVNAVKKNDLSNRKLKFLDKIFGKGKGNGKI